MCTWRERCVAAQARGEFTAQDKSDAAQWEFCAIGEQHRWHPEVVRVQVRPWGMSAYEPVDESLRWLGGWTQFLMAVGRDKPARALKILDQIEDRVLAMKREAS